MSQTWKFALRVWTLALPSRRPVDGRIRGAGTNGVRKARSRMRPHLELAWQHSGPSAGALPAARGSPQMQCATSSQLCPIAGLRFFICKVRSWTPCSLRFCGERIVDFVSSAHEVTLSPSFPPTHTWIGDRHFPDGTGENVITILLVYLEWGLRWSNLSKGYHTCRAKAIKCSIMASFLQNYTLMIQNNYIHILVHFVSIFSSGF